LNEILKARRRRNTRKAASLGEAYTPGPLDLSGLDLSELDLTGRNLIEIKPAAPAARQPAVLIVAPAPW
jgi:hypothetical protein